MVDISVNELHEMSVGQLERCIQRMNEELSRRRQLERTKAIDEFKKAFDHLRDLNIVPSYCEYDDEEKYLENWDGFNFNY
jgi:hypothetical protein